MNYECAIIGGGPAGLNAALVLGRARRKVLLFDCNEPRNKPTRMAHGFLTRDGVPPAELRRLAHSELAKYPSVEINCGKVVSIRRLDKTHFELKTEKEVFHCSKIILATGLKDEQPNIPNIEKFYGTSIFSCPYCDGWELRDRPLAVIADKNVFKLAKEVYIWSRDLVVFTNGEGRLELEEHDQLLAKGIQVYEDIISGLEGENGQLRSVRLEDGTLIDRYGGFVTPLWSHPNNFAEELGCDLNEYGGIKTDEYGRTNVWNVYAAGDAANIVPSQLIIAAGSGSAAAIGVNGDLTNEFFDGSL
ncbi:NAD(P)/FAD-dependent oxidoreductase [Sporosarcina thermotolerans]|uniref:NAD(P)/FAD-dependent oxidoreductase n=1 Tax=Sporosarcina thermotolerans TaxID=633404 RepID=A0AAW9A6V6_9BACL|nr:NAD(P)/FAD-dependent oxidoreductase [Sporosarcina thermotolerans]MDW0116675.1 NAD(P)/FAD-dependent oxidoreductase [Sporosarcina thermotolerans]WHT48872.1 NAD(P)/FAD-dependent oxidoreductase [Sporosarcina thermotolerans]